MNSSSISRALFFSLAFITRDASGAIINYPSGTVLTSPPPITFVSGDTVYFQGNASMGTGDITNGAIINMQDVSTCANSKIINNYDLLFYENSTAGSANITNNGGGYLYMQFHDNSTAGNSTIVSNSILNFRDNSTAGNAHITNNSQIVVGNIPVVPGVFSTLGDATVINNSALYIYDNGRGGNAKIFNNAILYISNGFVGSPGDLGSALVTQSSTGGTYFDNDGIGDQSTFVNDPASFIHIAGANGVGVGIGSIDGAGDIYLGTKQLTIGGLNKDNSISGVIQGVGGSLVKIGTGVLTLSGTNSYTGTTDVVSGGLRAGAPTTFSFSSAMNIEPGAFVDLAGFNQIIPTLTNNGVVNLFGEAPGTVLGVLGNLNEGSGGFHFLTNIGDSIGDHLIILGSSLGNYYVTVKNVGSAPLDPYQKLEIISTTDGVAQFSLVGGSVDAGPYLYLLEEIGTHWYLVNSGIINKNVQSILNNIRAESTSWFLEMGNLLDRLGELRLQKLCGCLAGGVWARGFGQAGDYRAVEDMPQFNSQYYGGQLGFDSVFNDQFYVGVFAGVGSSDNSLVQSDIGDSRSLYTGLYLSYLHPMGWYIDLVGKVNRIKNCVKSYDTINPVTRTEWRNYGVGFSLETGYRYCIRNMWIIEPQLQYSYLHLTGNEFFTKSTVLVNNRPAEAMQFRASLLAGYLFSYGQNATFEPYARFSYIEQVSFGSHVQIWDKQWRPHLDGSLFDLDVGLTAQVSYLDQLYASFKSTWGKSYNLPWGFNIGFRHSF